MGLSPDPSAQYSKTDHLTARIDLHQRFSVAERPWFSWVFDWLSPFPHARILDVGCGRGTLWLANRTRLEQTYDICLADSSMAMAADAARSTGFPTVRADVGRLPFDSAVFDVVVANHMLYHTTDLDRALSELRRVMKPDGHLVACTNGQGHMAELDHLYGAEPIALSFTLENGVEILRRQFRRVARHRHQDELRVTDADAAVAYLSSYRALDGCEEDAIRRRIDHDIDHKGAFAVSKRCGAFVARP